MPTFNQLVKRPRSKRPKSYRFLSLKNKPQIRGVVVKVITRSPKKPNSAVRKLCHVVLSNKKRTNAYIGGEGHTIQEYDEVIVSGARRKDLPGVRTRVIRGKCDADPVANKKNKRSKYGTAKK